MTLVSSWLTSPQNSNGNIGSDGIEWEWGRKNRQFLANKSPYLRNGARYNHSYNDRLIGSRIRAFDWYQNHRPWMTSKTHSGALWCRKDAYFGANCANWNEDRPIHARQKCRPMTLVSGNIRYVWILAGVPLGGDLKWECRCWRRQFLAIWVATSSETSEIRPAILYDDMLPLVGLGSRTKGHTDKRPQLPIYAFIALLINTSLLALVFSRLA